MRGEVPGRTRNNYDRHIGASAGIIRICRRDEQTIERARSTQ